MVTGKNQSVQQPKGLQKDSELSEKKESTANDLLKFAGKWEGDDLEECLAEVYKTRGETVFQ